MAGGNYEEKGVCLDNIWVDSKSEIFVAFTHCQMLYISLEAKSSFDILYLISNESSDSKRQTHNWACICFTEREDSLLTQGESYGKKS